MVSNWTFFKWFSKSLHWRHNGRDDVSNHYTANMSWRTCVVVKQMQSNSNHQPRHCLLNRLFRRRSKKLSKVRVTGEFPARMASNAENVSIWWHHHATNFYTWICIDDVTKRVTIILLSKLSKSTELNSRATLLSLLNSMTKFLRFIEVYWYCFNK